MSREGFDPMLVNYDFESCSYRVLNFLAGNACSVPTLASFMIGILVFALPGRGDRPLRSPAGPMDDRVLSAAALPAAESIGDDSTDSE